MTKLHNEIIIRASVEKVWAVLSDLKTVGHYNPLVREVSCPVEQKTGVGASRQCAFIPGGFSEERVIAWEPGRMMGMEVIESSWPMAFCQWHTVLSPVPEGTRVSQDLTYQVKFGPAGWLLDVVMMRRKYRAVLNDVFAGMKRYIETTV